MKTRLILALALVLGLPFVASAQPVQRGIVDYVLAEDWDLDATTYTAPLFTSLVGVVSESGTPIQRCITTVGSSVTTTGVTGQSAFASAAVGDEITVIPGVTAGTPASSLPMIRYIATRPSADSITVGPIAWDLSATPGGNGCAAGYTFRLKKFLIGTAATAGWVPVQNFSLISYLIQTDQLNTTTGIDYKVECRHRGNGLPDIINLERDTTTYTTTGTLKVPDITTPYDDCRIMLRMNTTDDGGDLTTNLEKINITLHGVVRN